jgi:hypothetical protein
MAIRSGWLPKQAKAEVSFETEWAWGVLRGRIDVHSKANDLVVDIKSVRSFKFVKRPEQLATDPQMRCYALATEAATIRHVYLRTQGEPAITQATYHIPTEEWLQWVDWLDETAHKIASLDSIPDPLPRAPLAEGCQAFGGCFYRERCLASNNPLSIGKITMNPYEYNNPPFIYGAAPTLAQQIEAGLAKQIEAGLAKLEQTDVNFVYQIATNNQFGDAADEALATVAGRIAQADGERALETIQEWERLPTLADVDRAHRDLLTAQEAAQIPYKPRETYVHPSAREELIDTWQLLSDRRRHHDPINPPDAPPNAPITKADDPVAKVNTIGKTLVSNLQAAMGLSMPPTVGQAVEWICADETARIKAVGSLSPAKFQAMLAYLGDEAPLPVTPASQPTPTPPAVQIPSPNPPPSASSPFFQESPTTIVQHATPANVDRAQLASLVDKLPKPPPPTLEQIDGETVLVTRRQPDTPFNGLDPKNPRVEAVLGAFLEARKYTETDEAAIELLKLSGAF